MVAEITSFCCGLSLKTGTIIIGITQSILTFVLLILSSAYADNPHELIAMSDPSIIPELHTLRSILITIAIASALLCVFSILLIFGAETNRPMLLMPWLIFNPFAIIIYIIGTLIALVNHGGLNNTAFVIGHLIIGVSCCLIGTYKILAVHSFYKHLKRLNF